MRVILTGNDGPLGRRLEPALEAAGHEVAVVEDAAGFAAVEPEAVIHAVPAVPARRDGESLKAALARNDRRRGARTPELLAAARAAGARRFIAHSVAFAYAPVGDAIKAEEDPLYRDAPAPLGAAFGAVAAMEDAVLAADEIDGVVLRLGILYGPGTIFGPGGAVERAVRRRRVPLIGGGSGVLSFVHVEDAAQGTVAALTAPPGAYNLVDDEPTLADVWLPAYAAHLGAKRPRRLPAFLARLRGWRPAIYLMNDVRGALNEKARATFDWRPRAPGFN